ncbi:MAG: DUF4290 domain-containing protein [Bacteroidales bacterium]|nr:DUF4290 domain-containing protein [Bacteroidales bacterium]
MEYNTKRGDMQYREYGRNVKKMVEFVCGLEESEKKNQAVRSLVNVMGLVSGLSIKDDVSYHKLWDHLMVLSSFRLESAWPFGQEELDALKQRMSEDHKVNRERLHYKNSNINRRHYGAYLEAMMKKLKDMPDGDEYDALSMLIAQQAKRSYLVWNGELSSDNIVVDQLAETSGDSRIKDKFQNKNIYVSHNSLPTDVSQNNKKRKKKK